MRAYSTHDITNSTLLLTAYRESQSSRRTRMPTSPVIPSYPVRHTHTASITPSLFPSLSAILHCTAASQQTFSTPSRPLCECIPRMSQIPDAELHPISFSSIFLSPTRYLCYAGLAARPYATAFPSSQWGAAHVSPSNRRHREERERESVGNLLRNPHAPDVASASHPHPIPILAIIKATAAAAR